ncbi:MAG: phosphodiester glycosidase family protein [Bacilli bacterium]
MRKRKKKKIYKTTIVFIILDIIVAICFFIMYGPWSYIRNLYVTTAMQTMNHKYLAKVFYSDKKINEIQNNNYLITINEDGNLDEIKINTKEKTTYKDEYEKELLTREPGNDLYKVIDVKVGNAKGYLVAIYKPEKVKLLRTSKFNAGTYGERVIDMCKRYGGTVCINGGGFANGLDNGSDIPQGYVIDNGQVVWPTQGDYDNIRGDIIGITSEGKLKLMNNASGNEAINAGIKYGIEFGPFLIVNGKSVEIKGMPYGVANKCVIAQTKDGVTMFLVTEGESYIDGASLKDVIDVLEKYGAYNAANLDGGQSTSLVIDNKLVNSPNYLAKKQGGRYVVTGWGLIP